jgi:hypothetical protein
MEYCPTCRARLKGALTCPRCGAEVSLLLEIVTQAELWRKQAINLLRQGDWVTANLAITHSLSLKQDPFTLLVQNFILQYQATVKKEQYRQAQEALQTLHHLMDTIV